jgi:DNA repair exonuclease SbcCD ATPase subunit
LCGYDFHTFENAVYIDDAVSNGFLLGTQKERMDLIHKLVNLERFEQALGTINEDLKRNSRGVESNSRKLVQLGQQREDLETEIQSLGEQITGDWEIRRAAAEKEVAAAQRSLAALAGSKDAYQEMQRSLDDLCVESERLLRQRSEISGELQQVNRQRAQVQKLIAEGRCGMCGQPTREAGKKMLAALPPVDKLEEKLQKVTQARLAQQTKINELDEELLAYQRKTSELEGRLSEARSALGWAEQGAREERERNLKLGDRKRTLAARLFRTTRLIGAVERHLQELAVDGEMLDYAQKACSRSGMPLLLCAQLCPVLNAAAVRYAEIFFDGKQQVRFAAGAENFGVAILNPSGSSTIVGQSDGEAAMAGLVTAFALREAAPQTNVLILDEPANGLDPEGVRSFARGLLALKRKFSTILVTTHNAALAGILEEEKTWTVVKEQGVSRLES